MNIMSGAVRAFGSSVVLVLASIFSSVALAAHIDPAALVKLSDKVARGEPVKLIVRLKGDSSAKALNTNARAVLRSLISAKQQALLKRHGGWFKTVKHYRETPYVALETDQKGFAALLADGDVVSIEEDIPLEMTLNDTPIIIDADQAWSSGYRGAGQAVAILDTGVDTAHPFLAGKVVAEACFSQNSASTTSLCPNGQNSQTGPGSGVSCSDAGCWHGTHVAGIAAGKSGILGGAGMSPDAKIIPIQVFTRSCAADGSCSLQSYSSDMGLALDHVFQLSTTIKIAAVNLSLGGGSYTAACDNVAPSIKELIDTLRNVNIATVISSGNGSATNAISFPACISSAVSVGATTKQNTVASYSNSSAQLALLAPGSSIYSSVSGGGYGTASGTSMAAPHMTGVWALMKSAKPSATVTEVLTALQSTGLPITDARNSLSKPLIQVGGSAGAIAKMVGAANQSPTVTLTGPANNAIFTAPATMTLTASASDADGSVAKVEFYQGTTLISTDTNGADGWSVNWASVPAGSYTLTAKAFDTAGASTASLAVSISVTTAGVGSDTVWVEDSVPSGATVFSDAESWNWVSTPLYSGSLAHASGLIGGMHQHYFYNASATLPVQTGDTLYAYVYLDPANPPREVMLQWNNGGWNARAYWGANLIGWGTDGTASRKYMGPLPASGQWVRLEVPASAVGLEGKILNGMAFTLYDGKAIWDKAGKTRAPGSNQSPTVTLTGPANNASFIAPAAVTLTAAASDADGSITKVEFYQGPSLIGTDTNGTDGWSINWASVPVGNYTLMAKAFDNAGANTASLAVSISVTAAGGGSDTVWVEDAVPSGATVFSDAESWNWVSTPLYSGSLAHASGLVGGMHQHYFYNASATLPVQTGDTLYAYVYLDPANPPREVMLQWNNGGWNARAYWGANLIGWGTDGTASRKYMGPLPASGQWVRLEVPASAVGLEGKILNGMAFTLYDGKAIWDKAGKRAGTQ